VAVQEAPVRGGRLLVHNDSTGQISDGQPISYRVAATIVEILPDGVVVLEAHKSRVDNTSLWIYMLSGKVDPKKRSADGSVLSGDIADLSISKVHHGADSAKRPWFIHLYDLVEPF
jgi:flagellar L-ring protein precursor FlgH